VHFKPHKPIKSTVY